MKEIVQIEIILDFINWETSSVKGQLNPQLVTTVGYFEGLFYPYFVLWADYQPRADENITNISMLRV